MGNRRHESTGMLQLMNAHKLASCVSFAERTVMGVVYWRGWCARCVTEDREWKGPEAYIERVGEGSRRVRKGPSSHREINLTYLF